MKILPFSDAAFAVTVSETAQRRLRESPYFFLRNLTCEFDSGVLILRGQVPYRQLKAIAEAIVSRVEGVHDVLNWVEVIDPIDRPIGTPGVRKAG